MKEILPTGWIQIPFISLFDINGGTQPPKQEFIYQPQKGYIRLLQIRDFGERPVPTYIPDDKNLRTCKENDILIARYGASIGRIVTGMEGAYNVALAKVVIPDSVNKRYVYWLLNSYIFQNPITSFQRTAQNGFNKNDLKEITIPIAPLPEQNRIVAKLDALFAHLDTLKTKLDRIPELLKNFRQQVLTQAVTGKLTEEWRKGNGLNAWENNLLIELIVEKPRNGFSPKSVDFKTNVKSLTLSATTSGKFNPEFVKYLDIERPPLDSHLWLKNGDILVQRSNSLDYVGTSAIYDGEDNDFIYPDLMMKIRVNDKVLAKYLNYCLSSNEVRDYFKKNATGTAGNMPKINQETVINTPINTPPLEEQTEIVRSVEELFRVADNIEARYKSLKEKIDTLPQAILTKAFKGELVPQNPNDEPASVLLERIKKAKINK